MTMKLCVICGEPCESSRCNEHPAPAKPKTSATQRGYTSSWDRLSKRARQIQPWCSACGTKDDLTGDHLRWPAKSLKDVDVLCRSCNSAKGAPGRTEPTTGQGAKVPSKDPRVMANFPTHSEAL